MSTKDTIIFDLNLFSGSSETIRQEFGGYYRDEDGQGDIEFLNASLSDPSQIDSIESYGAGTNTNSILPRFIYPNRIFSSLESDIRTDDEWKKYIIGGTFAEKTYSGIYNSRVYTDHANKTPLPYLPRETIGTNLSPSVSLTTEYYNQYTRYQAKTSGLSSELMIPNFYTTDPNIQLLKEFSDSNSAIASQRYLNMIEYLTNTFPNENTNMDSNMENIFVINPSADLDDYSQDRVDTSDLLLSGKFDSDLEKTFSLLPFGNKFVVEKEITNPFESDTYQGNLRFRQLMESNNFQVKFLKMLKETFQGESELQAQTVNFGLNVDEREERGIETTTTQTVKLVDLPTMILNSYKNPVSQNSNITVINSSSYQSQIDYAFDESGIYRYENTQRSLQILNTFMDEVGNIVNVHSAHITDFQKFLNLAGKTSKKYNETVAFRIEKIGGQPSGDLNTQNTIQNIWFFNSKEAFTYFDTQVKYGNEYTYKIYKYVIVQGFKYQLSDIRVTRQLSEVDGTYCLQFYDPFTGQVVPQISSDETLLSRYEQNEEIRQEIRDLNVVLYGFGGESIGLYGQLEEIQISYSDNRSGINLSIFSGGLRPATTLRDLVTRIYPDDVVTNEDNKYRRLLALDELYREIRFGNIPLMSEIKEIDPDSLILGSTRDTKSWVSDLHGNTSVPDAEAFLNILQAFNDHYKTLVVGFGTLTNQIAGIEQDINELNDSLSPFENRLDDNTKTFSTTPYMAEYNTIVEPSVKIVEIPLEQKRMRIIDHPPNDFVVTPHHLLDQTNRLAFYMKYDTFSKNEVTYPYPLSRVDAANKESFLIGHDFIDSSFLTQETPTPVSSIEVFRIQKKPTSYEDFVGASRKIINLREPNGDTPSDHLFVERVRENIKYYYVFRAINDNGVGGQLSPVFESELINDGGYVYGLFNQLSQEDLIVSPPKEPLLSFKKLINIIPNIQHLQLDTTTADFSNSSSSEIDEVMLATGVEDPIWSQNNNKYFKIRLTSKKTGRKIDLNIGFEKETKK